MTRFGRVVLGVAALAQLFGVAAGPLDHWRQSSRLGPHVEESGGSLGHYVHDEARCVACSLASFAATPPRRDVAPPGTDRAGVLRSTSVRAPSFAVLRTQSAPRAPPSPRRLSIGLGVTAG